MDIAVSLRLPLIVAGSLPVIPAATRAASEVELGEALAGVGSTREPPLVAAGSLVVGYMPAAVEGSTAVVAGSTAVVVVGSTAGAAEGKASLASIRVTARRMPVEAAEKYG